MTDAPTIQWLTYAVADAIVESVWQGAAIAVVAALLLRAMRRAPAQARYLTACVALLVMVGAWTATIGRDWQPPDPVVRQRIALARSTVTAPSVRLARALDDRASTPPSSPLQTWRARVEARASLFVAIWLVGVIVCSTRFAVACTRLRRLRRLAQGVVPPDVVQRMQRLASALGIHRSVRIVQSAAVAVPTMIGWAKPLILLPASALSGLTPSQLDAIVAHELGHIRRHDFLVNLAQNVVEALLFYHPACWWLSRRIREERELCCDDLAVRACGDRRTYATALATLETLRIEQPALALGAADGPLLRRIRRLVTPRAPRVAADAWIAAAIPLLTIVVAVVASSAAARAQSATPTPARVIPAGRGIIEGQVTDAGTQRGIANATVSFVGPARQITATTDHDGHFESAAIEPGNYRVDATADDYAGRAYGAADNADDQGALVPVTDGQFTRHVDIALRGTGIVTGRIVDGKGHGTPGVEVELVQQRDTASGSTPTAVAFAQSEDDGVFRFTQVLPGDYWLRAYASRRTEQPDIITRATFFPGVAHVEEAQPLHVSSGVELPGNDFSLLTTATRRVAGRIRAPDFDPAATEIELVSPGENEFRVRPRADGRFTIDKVAPGEYMLAAFDRAHPAVFAAAMQMITVDDQDIADLEIVGKAGAHVDGRIVAAPDATTRLNPAGTSVTFPFMVPQGGIHLSGGPPAGADGRFTAEIGAGTVWTTVNRLPHGWMVDRVLVDGVDTGVAPIALGEGAHATIEIVATDRLTRVTGRVVDRDGRSAPNAWVIVFPADPAGWSHESLAFRQMRAGQDGTFTLEGLPPGEYLAADATSASPAMRLSDELLPRLSRSATRFRVADGGTQSVRVPAETGRAQ